MRATRRPYRNLIIANRNGATVRLGDVATVLDMQDGATENIRTYGLYNGRPAVFVTVYQQPGANIIEMIDAVKAELPVLKSSIDPKIDLVVNVRPLGHHPRLAAAGRADADAGRGHGHSGRLHIPQQRSCRADSRDWWCRCR